MRTATGVWDIIRTDPDGTQWVKATAHIRKNETGEVRNSTGQMVWIENGDPCPFWWEDGNGSCDCNREMEFERCNGVQIYNQECGNGRFSVNLSNPVNSEVFYREFEDPAPSPQPSPPLDAPAP